MAASGAPEWASHSRTRWGAPVSLVGRAALHFHCPPPTGPAAVGRAGEAGRVKQLARGPAFGFHHAQLLAAAGQGHRGLGCGFHLFEQGGGLGAQALVVAAAQHPAHLPVLAGAGQQRDGPEHQGKRQRQLPPQAPQRPHRAAAGSRSR